MLKLAISGNRQLSVPRLLLLLPSNETRVYSRRCSFNPVWTRSTYRLKHFHNDGQVSELQRPKKACSSNYWWSCFLNRNGYTWNSTSELEWSTGPYTSPIMLRENKPTKIKKRIVLPMTLSCRAKEQSQCKRERKKATKNSVQNTGVRGAIKSERFYAFQSSGRKLNYKTGWEMIYSGSSLWAYFLEEPNWTLTAGSCVQGGIYLKWPNINV